MTNSLLAMHPAVQHMVLYLMNINAVKYKWSSGIVLMAGKLLRMALLFRKVNLYVLHIFFSFLPILLSLKLQMCIQKLKIVAFQYCYACSSKQVCSNVSSLQLTSHEASLHLHSFYPDESVFQVIFLQLDHILRSYNGILSPNSQVSKLSNKSLKHWSIYSPLIVIQFSQTAQ